MEWPQVMGIACWCFVIGVSVGTWITQKEQEEDPAIINGRKLFDHLCWSQRQIDASRTFAATAVAAKSTFKWRGRTYEMVITEKEETA